MEPGIVIKLGMAFFFHLAARFIQNRESRMYYVPLDLILSVGRDLASVLMRTMLRHTMFDNTPGVRKRQDIWSYAQACELFLFSGKGIHWGAHMICIGVKQFQESLGCGPR